MKISALLGILALPLLSSCIVAGVCTNANECRQWEQDVKKNSNKGTNSPGGPGNAASDGYATNEQQSDKACAGEGPSVPTSPNAARPYSAAYHVMGNWERADKGNSLMIEANCSFKSADCGTEGTIRFVSTNATGTTSTTTTGGTNMSGATSATSPAAPTTNPQGVTLVLNVTNAPTQNKLKQNGTCLEQAEYECRHTHTISRLDLECWKKQDDSSNFVGVSGNYSLVQ